jgi:carbon-monoxide dehydrogenase large subunit
MSSMLKLGESITRREDRRFLTGHGRYAANTAPANALNVLFLRSPHAHAHIAGIDKDPALALPGVAAIFTATDLVADKVGHLPAISELKDEAGNRHREPAHLPMPVGKVRHVGDIVAMIVAETLEQARDAAEALAIDYEVLPAVVTAHVPLGQGRSDRNGVCLRARGPCLDALHSLAAPDRALHGNARGLVEL